MKNLYSPKTRKTYDARIIMDDNGGKYVHFLLEFAPNESRRNDDDHSGKSKERTENL